ncbi:MAG: SPASM domain-containing protein, partial [Spirochaetia bacterium]|nr:SPASM domain-containing protein [Spirochaetia bacterium]
GLGNKSCAALDGLISVAPDGAILPCSSWDEPVGNLLASSFQAVWFSEKAKTFKEKQHAPQTCRECSSFSACQGACPLYWRYTKSAPAGYQARIP